MSKTPTYDEVRDLLATSEDDVLEPTAESLLRLLFDVSLLTTCAKPEAAENLLVPGVQAARNTPAQVADALHWRLGEAILLMRGWHKSVVRRVDQLRAQEDHSRTQDDAADDEGR